MQVLFGRSYWNSNTIILASEKSFEFKVGIQTKPVSKQGLSWPWSYGSWIYNYLCNQCLSPLMLWIWISIRARCTTLCDKVCQWLATGRWFSPGPPVSSTYKTACHDITEILLKVALNTIKQTNCFQTRDQKWSFWHNIKSPSDPLSKCCKMEYSLTIICIQITSCEFIFLSKLGNNKQYFFLYIFNIFNSCLNWLAH